MNRPLTLAFAVLAVPTAFAQPLPTTRPGQWPEPRQNPHLTAVQSLPGAMRTAPTRSADYALPASRPPYQVVTNPTTHRPVALAIHAGRLRCYDTDGRLLWTSHPSGLNYDIIAAVDDLDADGHLEIVLQAGRPAEPYGAAVAVSLDDGRVIWRYDVEPHSYAWYLDVGAYLPDTPGKQVLVTMQGYPPDPTDGYLTLFWSPEKGQPPVQKWRKDFDQYTCFPKVTPVDLRGRGHPDITVISHSRVWVFDPATGDKRQFLQLDVSPANVRSYGSDLFTDVDGDGLPDLLVCANFSKHYEVALNDRGTLKQAWHQGWADSVTTAKVVVTWPADPPLADVDGDDRLDLVVSVFDADHDNRWTLKVHDARTGQLKFQLKDLVARTLVPATRDSPALILADRATEAGHLEPDGGCTLPHPQGAVLLAAKSGKLEPLWQDASAEALRLPATGSPRVRKDNKEFTLTIDPSRRVTLSLYGPPPPPPAPDFSAIPKSAGPTPPPDLLVADVLHEKHNQVLLYDGSTTATLLRLTDDNHFSAVGTYPSACLPVIADVNGDGLPDLVLGDVAPQHPPRYTAVTPALHDKALWTTELPLPKQPGLQQARLAYLRAGHFTGHPTPDLYVYAGTPRVRSAVLDGPTGHLVWEDSAPNDAIQRYFAPTMNLAAAYDLNHDGADDLVFTNPDFYCVADGKTGAPLIPPTSPQTIFHQPSQGLYTLPAVLDPLPTSVASSPNTPLVALVAGHYFDGVLSPDAAHAYWYNLPPIGQARCAAEGFLPAKDGHWLLGVPQQNGVFSCLDAATGKPRWTYDLRAAAVDVTACDITGAGSPAFLVATSDGKLYSLVDKAGTPDLLWLLDVHTPVQRLIPADVDGDGRTDLLLLTADGHLRLFPSPP